MPPRLTCSSRSRAASVLAVALALALPACTRDGAASTTTVAASATTAAGAGSVAATASTRPAGSPGSPAATPAGPRPTAPPPETGVPGLDSDDSFCAAWSAFAGSFQVIAVASSFLFEQPQRAFELEVAGSVTVTDAYAALGEAWPAALDAERTAALDGLFGPFATRAGRARVVLERELPDGSVAIAEAWVAALATRNPDDPDVAFVAPPELAAGFAAAAAAFASAEPPIYADPALVTEATTPLTDAYLAANCPDQGLLAGGDVDG